MPRPPNPQETREAVRAILDELLARGLHPVAILAVSPAGQPAIIPSAQIPGHIAQEFLRRVAGQIVEGQIVTSEAITGPGGPHVN